MFEGENLQETCFCHQIRRLPVNHPAKKKNPMGGISLWSIFSKRSQILEEQPPQALSQGLTP